MEIHSDQQYVQALLDNDNSLLQEMYAKYAPSITNMVLKNNGTEADANDIFQDALIAIYQKAKNEGFKLSCPLGAYLHLICRNRWINELKRKGNNTVTISEDGGYSDIGSDVFKEAAIVQNNFERRALLTKSLALLGEGCKSLLTLNWSGLPLDTVAEKLSMTYGYVRKKKSECMEKLITIVKTAPNFETLKW